MEVLNVKVGDKVIITNRDNRKTIGIVEKVTPTGRINVNGSQYSKDGCSIGGDVWSRKYINIATDDAIMKIKQANFVRAVITKMNDFSRTLEYNDAVKILDILREY